MVPLKIVCFSHLRWNFVYQRPQHLLGRFARQGDVHLWEEPIFESRESPALARSTAEHGVHVLTPLLPHGFDETSIVHAQRELLDQYLQEQNLEQFVAWYYTPMALKFSSHLSPAVTVYDCMDELSAFQDAPPELIQLEAQLFSSADVVFAGGASLYQAKRTQHGNVRLYPSSVDRNHFAAARNQPDDPFDQSSIPHPRIGFFGVLDERLDRDLLRDVAALHPEWHFVLVGPVVKIHEADLPRAANLHYLGQKAYAELPGYLGHWDVAMLPFARNASTRFISPTKTPEYLAAGKPVVSTPIQDVVTPYADLGLVRIGKDAAEFADAIGKSLQTIDPTWLRKVDTFLGEISWDKTFEGMWNEIERCTHKTARTQPQTSSVQEGVANV